MQRSRSTETALGGGDPEGRGGGVGGRGMAEEALRGGASQLGGGVLRLGAGPHRTGTCGIWRMLDRRTRCCAPSPEAASRSPGAASIEEGRA